MPPFPSRISRYDIKSLIGTGGMGTLYLARDTNPNTNRLVAIKLLNAYLDSGDLRERFGREARALAALNHPNIVNIYDCGEFQGSPFIVMEYVRGETIAEKIKRKAPLSLRQKLKLMAELCAGLGHAHEAGLIHRDIKPPNLMVDQHGRLKILDFGIARVSEGSLTRAGLQVTQFNVRVGTPGYMSPEQIETGEIDRRSDIFAVGAVFYELLSYIEAFSGASTRQIENKVLQTQPAPLPSLVPDLDPEIAAIVTKALEKDPANRYQDAAALEEAIEQQQWRLGRVDTPAPTVRPTPPPQSPGRSSRDSRAEAAFQRSVAFYREGALDAARRSAIEALAEDPAHEGAFTFLERLERQEPDRWPIPRVLTHAPEPTSATAGRTSVEGATEARTAYGSSERSFTPMPPTIVGPRRDPPGPSSGRRWPELWRRYRTAALVVAVIAVTAGIAVIVMRLAEAPPVRGQLLTVTRPTGGTITGSGINCGTNGSECSTTVPDGEPVELETHADTGFMFTGYTGDCLSTGRTLMTVPRTCGGTFAPLPDIPKEVPRVLTISRPKGGTILSAGITCGTLGSDCSATHPDGEQITLAARADEGFTFQGFSGDCAGASKQSIPVVMDAPRTCGATFIARAVANSSSPPTPVPVETPTRPSGGGGGDAAVPPTPTYTPPVAPPVAVSSGGGGGGGGGASNPDIPAVPPPISAEQVAKNNIDRLLKDYCAAYQKLDVPGIVRVYPKASPTALTDQFRQYKTAGCALMGPPEFVDLDAQVGIATIEVAVKLSSELRSGGGPKPVETVMVAKLVRPEPRGNWIIESLTHRPKR